MAEKKEKEIFMAKKKSFVKNISPKNKREAGKRAEKNPPTNNCQSI
jgi:hypothetical protein